MAEQRAHWGSRFGFILAAAGSAVGLGNIWKFPYITGANGGGWFVLIYLACIAVIGLPIMMAEILVGRTTQRSPVGACRALTGRGSPWIGVGWFGVVTAFVILSFYSVVAGWALHYTWLSMTNAFAGRDAAGIGAQFDGMVANPWINLFWHGGFMAITMVIVMGGIQKGLERCARILMPVLCLMMLVLVVRAAISDSGWTDALAFVFKPDNEVIAGRWGPAMLEAMGHAFFTLSLGMGAMITYGSYLKKDEDIVTTSVTVGVLDTGIALLACMALFPIVFSFDAISPGAGPGLVFRALPVAFGQMTGGTIWATVFFLLLTFAALTSAIGLLEVAASYFIDERGWSRAKAVGLCGSITLLLGIPSALSGGHLFGDGFARLTAVLDPGGEGVNWLDMMDYVASNWLLPLGGLFIALFVSWRVGGVAREEAFRTGTRFGAIYWTWVQLLRYLVPVAVIAVMLYGSGILGLIWPDVFG